jgi:hypothetical protein
MRGNLRPVLWCYAAESARAERRLDPHNGPCHAFQFGERAPARLRGRHRSRLLAVSLVGAGRRRKTAVKHLAGPVATHPPSLPN